MVALMDGRRLEELRKATGLSKEQMAVHAGVTVDAVKKWERQGTIPGTDKFVCIAEALGLGLDALAAEVGLRQARPVEATNLPPEWRDLCRYAIAIGITPDEARAAIKFVHSVKTPSAAQEKTPPETEGAKKGASAL